MAQLDPLVLWSVFQEMLGPLLWLLAALIVVGTLAFAALLLRERKLVAKRLVYAEFAGLVGGALALVLMAVVSSSGFTDAGGPVDWLLIALIYALGAIGTTVLVYTVAGWGTALRDRAHA
jgi:hypothetical protein